MQCPNCKNEINGDENFCPHCGTSLGNLCPVCHYPVSPQDKFCPNCGQKLKEDNGYYEPINDNDYYQPIDNNHAEEEKKSKVNFKPIIIGLIIIALLTAGSYAYINSQSKQKITSNETNSKEETKTPSVDSENSYVAYTGNINLEGKLYMDGDTIYMVNEKGYLVSVDKEFQNDKVLLEETVSYISVYDQSIYFADSNNYLCKVDKDGQNKEILIKKAVYYVMLKNDNIYYQLDSDQESLYVYSIKDKKSTKLNDSRTYCPNISDDKIYYTSTDGIYCMDLDGKNDSRIIEGKVYNLIYDNNMLYYVDSSGTLYSYNLTDKSVNSILQYTYQAIKNGNTIYAYTTQGLVTYNVETGKTQTLYANTIETMQLAGNVVVVYSNNSWIAINEDGSTYEIFSDDDSSNFV
jgi:RNA polymerase subunit RPABC4/transcription elongation factor Spt4